MTYSSLANTNRGSFREGISKNTQMQATAPYTASATTSRIPPQSASVVADYTPFTEKYKYNTLLHHPPSSVGQPYNTSGYFTIMGGAYLSDCTKTIPRACNGRMDIQFTTD